MGEVHTCRCVRRCMGVGRKVLGVEEVHGCGCGGA